MAFDYIKSVLPSKYIKGLEKHPLLEFKRVLNESTGELSHKRVAKYQGLIFEIRLNKIWMNGSIHYFYNKGRHNYNDFTYSKIIQALNRIEETFGLDLSKCELRNLEIGVNIRLPLKTSIVLENVIFHSTKRFKDKAVKRGKGDFRVVVHDNFSIKIYDKGLQFGLPYELMRFEIHYNRMAGIKKYSIPYLSDLKDRNKLELLKGELIKRFDEVFLYDWTIKESKIKRKPKGFYDWRLVQYWIKLNKSNRDKRKNAYKEVVIKYSDNVKRTIRGLIEQKMNELIYPKGDLFTVENTEFQDTQKKPQKATFSQSS